MLKDARQSTNLISVIMNSNIKFHFAYFKICLHIQIRRFRLFSTHKSKIGR